MDIKMGIEYKLKCLKVITARIEGESVRFRANISGLPYAEDTEVSVDYLQLLLSLRKKFFKGTMNSITKLTAKEDELLENVCSEVDDENN